MRFRSSPRIGSAGWLKRKRLGEGSSTTTASSAAFSGGDLHGLGKPYHHSSHQWVEMKREDKAGVWERGIGQRLDDGGEFGAQKRGGRTAATETAASGWLIKRRRQGIEDAGGFTSAPHAACARSRGTGATGRAAPRRRTSAARERASGPPRVNSVTLFRLLFNFSNYSQICVTT